MGRPVRRTPTAELFRLFLLDMLQLEGLLARQADELTGKFGQSTARWKVLTAANCDVRTVPQIARRMGLTRQGVQRIANLLVDDGLAEFIPNPDHQGSPILQPTAKGVALDDAICDEHARFSNRIAPHLDARKLESAIELMGELSRVVS